MKQLKISLLIITAIISINSYSYDCNPSCDSQEEVNCLNHHYGFQIDIYNQELEEYNSNTDQSFSYDQKASTKTLEKKLKRFRRNKKNRTEHRSKLYERKSAYDLNRFDNFLEFAQERNSGCNRRSIRKVSNGIDDIRSEYKDMIQNYDERINWLEETIKKINKELTQRKNRTQTEKNKPRLTTFPEIYNYCTANYSGALEVNDCVERELAKVLKWEESLDTASLKPGEHNISKDIATFKSRDDGKSGNIFDEQKIETVQVIEA